MTLPGRSGPTLPPTRVAACVVDGDYRNLILVNPVNDRVGKAANQSEP